MNETLPTIDPKTTALLVMDYQPAVLAILGESAPAALARVGEAIRSARARGVLVAYVRVAFDDADWMVASRPSITTVSQPTEEMVKLGWNLLLQRMLGGRNSKGAYTTTRLPCALQVRESTGSPPTQAAINPKLRVRLR